MLLLGSAVVNAEADNLSIERGELAGAPTEVGRLGRSARGVGLGEEEEYQVLLAPELAEIEGPTVVLWPAEGREGVANLDRHRGTSCQIARRSAARVAEGSIAHR
jgi:hypothetical protein